MLVDTEGLYFEATRTVLARVGVVLSAERFVDLSLRRGRSVFELVQGALDAGAIEELRSARNALYAERLAAGVPALEGIEEVLAALHGRVAMGVVTSSNPEHFELIHRGTGLLRYFDFVLTNRDTARSKPDPAPYLAALARARLGPEACIAVEDSERGLAAARAAGLRCLVVPRGLTRGGRFDGALGVVDGPRELAAALSALVD